MSNFNFPHMNHLEEALLELARALGQCFAIDKGKRCVRVNSHQGEHSDSTGRSWTIKLGYRIMSSDKTTGERTFGTTVYDYKTACQVSDRLNAVLVSYDHWSIPSTAKIPSI